ncbi:ribose 1,5-bisphosphate isomerase [Methanoculleus sp. FWC-SCC1]|uniref:Ribose 1,5-bisphosphate isomerase n=1 Tax=Methanoculleus frigidifontis TaxID=2584085 RepID=A0ABT8ME33_9EURY|nr:ribose 1,5-bisphosphate isomerase [Methanoculleus sp. FWC-SCC1]MDN7026200.1 ribose 1,5-bisphosphate isomerase [Methanoculleus sp. FWC-SCC1]
MLLNETAERIRTMEIRGAGRIARAAVEALAGYADTLDATDLAAFRSGMQEAAETLLATRPTAVSLPNAVHAVMAPLSAADSLPEARDAVRRRADAFVTSSLHAVERIADIGARHISDGDTVLTHCNSEAALACILEAHRQGKDLTVYATEVRPRNQGHLTIRALDDAGIRTSFIIDSAVRSIMNRITLVVVGADAITVNGAVVNKIGTAQIALAAHEARTNVVVAAETYKFAPRTVLGELIEIEERSPAEVLPEEIARTLKHVTVRNPAFDVTPAEYVDLIVTEKGAIPPELAYTIIREYLGWNIEDFQRQLVLDHRNQD